jgi:hypothetical protein
MASKLSAVLSVVFAVSLMLVIVTPFVAASSFFYRTYGEMENGEAFCVVQTSDGGYALVGFTQSRERAWLVKTDPDGNMEWNKTFEDGSANSIVQTGDGGYVIAGSTSSFGAGGSDFWLVKTDSVGNVEWNKTYGGSRDDSAKSMVQTSEGGYAIAGDTESYGVSFTDFLLVKTDSLGNMEWNKTYDAIKGRDYAHSVVQTSDGGYALMGRTQSSVVEGYDCRLVKTDSSGDMEWNKTYGYGSAHSVIQTSDGGYAMAGYKNFQTFCLVKTDEVGIIPEFLSLIILPLVLTITLFSIIVKRKLCAHKT